MAINTIKSQQNKHIKHTKRKQDEKQTRQQANAKAKANRLFRSQPFLPGQSFVSHSSLGLTLLFCAQMPPWTLWKCQLLNDTKASKIFWFLNKMRLLPVMSPRVVVFFQVPSWVVKLSLWTWTYRSIQRQSSFLAMLIARVVSFVCVIQRHRKKRWKSRWTDLGNFMEFSRILTIFALFESIKFGSFYWHLEFGLDFFCHGAVSSSGGLSSERGGNSVGTFRVPNTCFSNKI